MNGVGNHMKGGGQAKIRGVINHQCVLVFMREIRVHIYCIYTIVGSEAYLVVVYVETI